MCKTREQGIQLELFCQVCKTAKGNLCALIDHKGHAKIGLDKAAKGRKLEIIRMLESKKRKAQKRVTRVAKLSENYIQVPQEAARIKATHSSLLTTSHCCQ